jgi:hypothetical protein
VFARRLRMAAGARIASLTVAANLDYLDLGVRFSVGRSNWITQFANGTSSPHFV